MHPHRLRPAKSAVNEHVQRECTQPLGAAEDVGDAHEVIIDDGSQVVKREAIVLHEDTLTGGFGGEIAARITEKAFDCLDAPVVRIAAPDTPVPYSPPLEDAFLPNADRVIEKARWLCAY